MKKDRLEDAFVSKRSATRQKLQVDRAIEEEDQGDGLEGEGMEYEAEDSMEEGMTDFVISDEGSERLEGNWPPRPIRGHSSPKAKDRAAEREKRRRRQGNDEFKGAERGNKAPLMTVVERKDPSQPIGECVFGFHSGANGAACCCRVNERLKGEVC